jgi:hypothetical protein
MNGTVVHTPGQLTKGDLVAKKTSAGVRYVSKAASQATKSNPKAMLWIKMAADYRKKHKARDGGMVLMPKKGTANHRKLVAAYHKKADKL